MPARDVIGKEHESSTKHLLAAVVTQCFSYMVHKCVQYGYVYTGEAFIFLHIPDDPTVVYYSICIPSLDVEDEDENRLHRTAVGQVTAFILRALAAESPTQAWHQATGTLLTWDVEYIDILKNIPETVHNMTRETFSYRPSRWKPASIRPHRRTRAQCLLADDQEGVQSDGDEDDGSDSNMPPTPTPGPTTRARARARTAQSSSRHQQAKQAKSADKQKSRNKTNVRVEDQPYCTHACLLGLLHSGPLDQQCPNIQAHRTEHIKPQAFLRLIKHQLAVDLGADADCKPLYIRGSRGALFKVRLSSHGYTMVAKGMQEDDARYIYHEHCMYRHVLAAQGTAVPVCLGLTELQLPYFYDSAAYTHMLFLSWASRPLSHFINKENAATLTAEAKAKLRVLHALGLLHKDAEMRNVLWDEQTGGMMWTDLERAEVQAEARAQQPLGLVSPNRTQEGPVAKKTGGSPAEFSRELMLLSAHVDRFVHH
ncbi:uncharacterized protein BKCO1_5600079 [Diplodia corticola]|uniref:Protein kinase domain-containing protein n=1 Tax=Diplodia corticola TaxID=236234 RepID=A0A1J9QS15_9PEZI|nr:uncharacterized protein BKCO1_5600079 [Diplodia corticola]OJD30786.1 hypothetical protein BKCO1_5600079 [Diplodia corticola]